VQVDALVERLVQGLPFRIDGCSSHDRISPSLSVIFRLAALR
jgi:hypothetical protein